MDSVAASPTSCSEVDVRPTDRHGVRFAFTWIFIMFYNVLMFDFVACR